MSIFDTNYQQKKNTFTVGGDTTHNNGTPRPTVAPKPTPRTSTRNSTKKSMASPKTGLASTLTTDQIKKINQPLVVDTSYVKSGSKPMAKLPAIAAPTVTPQVEPTTPVKDPMQGLSNTANAINAIQGITSGILAYKSVQSLDKMKPALVTPTHIEAAKITDTGAQMRAAGDQQIESSVGTAREDALRSGRSDMGGVFLAKELDAKNSLAGTIEGMRTNIEQANVQAENRVREVNANADAQAANINQNAINSMNQFKTQMKGATIQAGIANVNQNVNGIMANVYGNEQRKADLARYEDASEMELATMIGRAQTEEAYTGLVNIYRRKYPNGKYL